MTPPSAGKSVELTSLTLEQKKEAVEQLDDALVTGEKGKQVVASVSGQADSPVIILDDAPDQTVVEREEEEEGDRYLDKLFEGGPESPPGAGSINRSPLSTPGNTSPPRALSGGQGRGRAAARPPRYTPSWGLTPGSRFDLPGVCEDWFTFSVPPGERTYQRQRRRGALEDEICVNFAGLVSGVGEVVRECRELREGKAEVEDLKKALDEREHTMNQEVSVLSFFVFVLFLLVMP